MTIRKYGSSPMMKDALFFFSYFSIRHDMIVIVRLLTGIISGEGGGGSLTINENGNIVIKIVAKRFKVEFSSDIKNQKIRKRGKLHMNDPGVVTKRSKSFANT